MSGVICGRGTAALAQAIADATGKAVLIGVRPGDRGWFAHCDGLEFDGPPREALAALKGDVEQRARAEIARSNRSAAEAALCIERLSGEPA